MWCKHFVYWQLDKQVSDPLTGDQKLTHCHGPLVIGRPTLLSLWTMFTHSRQRSLLSLKCSRVIGMFLNDATLSYISFVSDCNFSLELNWVKWFMFLPTLFIGLQSVFFSAIVTLYSWVDLQVVLFLCFWNKIDLSSVADLLMFILSSLEEKHRVVNLFIVVVLHLN